MHIEDRGYQFADGVYEVVPVVHKSTLVDEDSRTWTGSNARCAELRDGEMPMSRTGR